MVKVKVRILPDLLIDVLGFDERIIDIEPGTYSFSELIEILTKNIPSLEDILTVKTLNREIFIAVDDRLSYDLNQFSNIREGSRIVIFTVGAGG